MHACSTFADSSCNKFCLYGMAKFVTLAVWPQAFQWQLRAFSHDLKCCIQCTNYCQLCTSFPVLQIIPKESARCTSMSASGISSSDCAALAADLFPAVAAFFPALVALGLAAPFLGCLILLAFSDGSAMSSSECQHRMHLLLSV